MGGFGGANPFLRYFEKTTTFFHARLQYLTITLYDKVKTNIYISNDPKVVCVCEISLLILDFKRIIIFQLFIKLINELNKKKKKNKKNKVSTVLQN